jgi:hypothetical protein
MQNRRYFLCFVVILSFTSIQTFSQKRIGIYNVDGISSKARRYSTLSSQFSSVFGAVPSYCVDFFSNNPDFITIDRKNQYLINSEIELQKSENFMDGYVVGQGKSEGVDYILQSIFDVDTYMLSIKVMDVKAQNVLCSAQKELNKNFWGIKDLNQQVNLMLLEINAKCFAADIQFVKILSSKGKKAKEFLMAGGSDLRLKKGYEVEIFKIVDEKVGAKIIKRKAKVGSGVVLAVEDENFSIVEINEGNEEILTEVTNKVDLFCKILND